jgi:hypothetical protein
MGAGIDKEVGFMRFRTPSPATLIALLALFVSLGGTSYAALKLPKASVGSKQLKKNAVTGPKVKPGSLRLSDFKSSDRSGLRGPAGAAGAAGAAGTPGADGTARAYAHVLHNTGSPTLDAAHTKNITAVSLGGTGIYCLQAAAGISSADLPAVVSADWGTSIPSNIGVHSHPGFNCAAGQFEVITRDNATAAYVNNISFYIIIP